MKTKTIIGLTTILLLAVMLSFSFNVAKVRAEAAVTTDKQDYSPGDTVTISGSGFTAGVSVTVSVTRPDETVNSWDITSDDSGGFTTTYALDGIMGTYTVRATDGTSTATTTFTDKVNLKILGVDGNPHQSAGNEEDLGSVAQGTALVKSITVSSDGSGTTTWSIGYDTSSGDGSTLSGKTIFTPSTGSLTPPASTLVQMSIATSSLAAGTYHGKLQATGTGGAGSGVYFFRFTVSAPINNPPTAEADGPYSVNEGSSTILSGSGTDLDGTVTAYSWDLDYDGVTFVEDTTDQNPTFNAATLDGPSSKTVALKVQDDDGAWSAIDTATVTIVNVAPTVTAPSNTGGNEGSSIAIGSFTFTDPAGALDQPFAVKVNYGDGGGDVNLDPVNYGTAISGLSHIYADNGVYTVTVTVTDKDNGAGSASMTVTVENVAPTITSLTLPIDPVKVGTTVAGSAIYTDPGILDTQTAVWDWGDGTTSPGTVAYTTGSGGSGSVSGSHIYTSAWIYTVTLTVTDKDGGSDTETWMYVVVYDPNGGFVTGGGWIISPAGAYRADPSLAGKATFGFVSKYQKGATVPTGNTEFQFHAGNLNFKSTSYEWLVVSGGNRAQYKGSGTINGAGSYKFMLTAIDGAKGNPDMFRIRIWDDSGLVYDNQFSSLDPNADPTTAIAGGSIVVHK